MVAFPRGDALAFASLVRQAGPPLLHLHRLSSGGGGKSSGGALGAIAPPVIIVEVDGECNASSAGCMDKSSRANNHVSASVMDTVASSLRIATGVGCATSVKPDDNDIALLMLLLSSVTITTTTTVTTTKTQSTETTTHAFI